MIPDRWYVVLESREVERGPRGAVLTLSAVFR